MSGRDVGYILAYFLNIQNSCERLLLASGCLWCHDLSHTQPLRTGIIRSRKQKTIKGGGEIRFVCVFPPGIGVED